MSWEIALLAVGTGLQAFGQIQQGQQQAAALRYNAAIAEQQGRYARDQARIDADTAATDARRRIGAAAAGFGASGVELGSGSPLDVLEFSAAEAERQQQLIQYRGDVRASGYEAQAGIDRFSASNAIRSSYLAAGSSLLQGGLKVAGRTGPSEDPFAKIP